MTDTTDRPPLCQADVGKRVVYHSGSDKCDKRGTLRYYGVPEFADGHWCGIELDGPTGKNDGCLFGIHYFQCEENHGVFVQANKVELDLSPPKRTHKHSGGGSRSVPHSPVMHKEFFKSSPPPLKKASTPAMQKALPFNAKLRQLTAKGQKTPSQPLKAFGSEAGSTVRKKTTAHKPIRAHLRRSSSGENINNGLVNGRLIKSASSECVQKAVSKELSPTPKANYRRSSHENFTAVPQRKSSKVRVQRWPLTSTPVKGEEASASSSSTSVMSTSVSDVEQPSSDQQMSTSDVAFVKTPEACDITDSSSTMQSSGLASTDDSIVGLQTPVSQLKIHNSDFIDANRVPSPEHHPPPQERFQNNSESATLSHPLSSANVPTIVVVATPSQSAATPTETAATPTRSASMNGIKSFVNSDDHHSNQQQPLKNITNQLMEAHSDMLSKEELIILLKKEYHSWQQKFSILEQQVSQLSAERDQLKHQLSVLSSNTTGDS
ncbi:uncharacterized protein [Dysidea avara]|uniref:uncharacterized protein isoform X2 n=1 Tax=Dysidea avara TaxID=196820 RepID=UPI00332806AD